MIDRIKVLEEKVDMLVNERANDTKAVGEKVSTAQIKAYIANLLDQAKAGGQTYLVVVANDVHRALKLTSRIPSVCNAMKQMKQEGDVVLRETASGFSTTYTIRYNLV